MLHGVFVFGIRVLGTLVWGIRVLGIRVLGTLVFRRRASLGTRVTGLHF